jgi:hypothetical protein
MKPAERIGRAPEDAITHNSDRGQRKSADHGSAVRIFRTDQKRFRSNKLGRGRRLMRYGQSPYDVRTWGWGRRSEIALSGRCALWPRMMGVAGIWLPIYDDAFLVLTQRARRRCAILPRHIVLDSRQHHNHATWGHSGRSDKGLNVGISGSLDRREHYRTLSHRRL